MSQFLTAFMTQPGPLFSRISQNLQVLVPSTLLIRDDSSKHANHAAMKGLTKSETHFHVTIVSSHFQNLSLINRHRKVNDLLKLELKEGVHALQLVTKTPEEYNQN
jgi:BolA protein